MNPTKRGMACVLTLALALAFVSGCVQYRAPVKPPLGGVYTDVWAPLMMSEEPTPTVDLRTASERTFYLFVPIPMAYLTFAWGRNDIESIVGPIDMKEIAFADYRIMSVIGLYAEMEIRVCGK